MATKMKVYTASKLSCAPLWRSLRESWPEVTFTARWPICHVGVTPDTAAFAKIFWDHDVEDIRAADVVMIYANTAEEKLRGALVEAGIGLALGLQIIVVGEHADYGTWQHHRSCHRVKDLPEAYQLLKTMAARL